MSRERYTVKLHCPSCGTGGNARASENDYPFMRSLARSIDSFPDGLKENGYSDKDNVTLVICECGEEFEA